MSQHDKQEIRSDTPQTGSPEKSLDWNLGYSAGQASRDSEHDPVCDEIMALNDELAAERAAHEAIADILLPLVGTDDGTSVGAARKAAQALAAGQARDNELKTRDKCSYAGPMRDCPTHGESSELAELRNRVIVLEPQAEALEKLLAAASEREKRLRAALQRLRKAVVGSIWQPVGVTGDESDWFYCELCHYRTRTATASTHNPVCPMMLAEAALAEGK